MAGVRKVTVKRSPSRVGAAVTLVTAGLGALAGLPTGHAAGGSVPVALPGAPASGNGGSVTAVMAPTVPLTGRSGRNEDPTVPGAPKAEPTVRFSPADHTFSVSLQGMDPARFPPSSASCDGSVSVNGAVVKGLAPTGQAAPATGTRLDVTTPGRSP